MAQDLQTQMKLFSNRIEKLSTELQLMKQYGLSDDLLVAYLCHNLKLPEKRAREIISCYEDFYSNFIKKGILNKLQS